MFPDIDDMPDPYGYEPDEREDVECKRCGKAGLEWEDDNGQWKLIDSRTGKVHICNVLKLHRSTLDEFDAL